jgi:hypothetical protein
MRLITALLLTLGILIDFSANCLAENFSICHDDYVSTSEHNSDFSETSQSHASHTHPHGSDSHHCHGGHTHVAVIFSHGSPLNVTSFDFSLDFYDLSLVIPSPSLSEINRPPIFA